ncbi:hypothetical protein, partial [Pseudomonas protegens]|uniref:hypothetical protein n=1 Tax=Pseudomonas protegens TaxID=380021 RepID=UPI001C82DB43
NFQGFGVKGYGTRVQSINGLNIYKLGSSTSGIGYAIYADNPSACYNGFIPLTNSNTENSNHRILCVANGTFPTQPIQGTIKLVFYKIGDITPGKIPAQTAASLILQNNQKDRQRPESY